MKKTFTLIELLVVVAIIGILISMLLPSLKKARESAKSAVCLNNLKQINIAVELYVGSFNSFYPAESSSNSPYTDAGNSKMILYEILAYHDLLPKTSKTKVWFCPSASSERQWSGTEPDYSPNRRLNLEKGLFARQAFGGSAKNFNQSRITYPSDVVSLFDSYNNYDPLNGTWLSPLIEFRDVGYLGAPKLGFATRHGGSIGSSKGKFNSVRADGHAKTISYKSFQGVDLDTRRRLTDANFE